MRKPFSLLLIIVWLVAGVVIAEAQQATKLHRIGFLVLHDGPSSRSEAFRQGLRKLGYVEGQNVNIEWRFAQGKPERVREMATELVRLKVDVIVAQGAIAPRAVKEATRTIPIVMVGSADPVGSGLIASLARPGGNVTGLTTVAADTGGKRLELLKEVVPGLNRVGVIWYSANPSAAAQLRK